MNPVATPCDGRQQVYTVEQVAGILGMGRSTAYDAVRRGEIPHLRVGRRVLVSRAMLDRWLGESDEVAVDMSEVRTT